MVYISWILSRMDSIGKGECCLLRVTGESVC